ncbi:MAG TPA: hypothetical protein ENI87_11905 [bacterium]|nr:hypothetical protein [bacterium]
MADDKKKEDSKDEGKKKGLPPIVMIAVGAILGGAGAVFAIPPKEIEVEKPAPVYEDIDVLHPDVIDITFNPRSRTGKAVAVFSFKFVYTVREDRKEEAYELLKQHWEDAGSRALILLSTRTRQEMESEKGKTLLEADLVEELDKTFFPEVPGEEKVATVTRVIWKKFLFQ